MTRRSPLAGRAAAVDGTPPPMTPERWRAVDRVLQDALMCDRGWRDAFVVEACGNDEALRREVASLLAAHDDAPMDFLERSAAEALGLAGPIGVESRQPQAPPSTPGRVVSAHGAVFAVMAGIGIGLVSGWGLAHSSLVGRWSNKKAVLWQPPVAATAAVDAGGADESGLSLVVLDRSGRLQRRIAANRPWTPRFSPDGRLVAYGAFGPGRQTSDLWVTDVREGATRRLTDDDADSNDPQWSPDGTALAFSVSAPGGKDVAEIRLSGGAQQLLAARPGTQFPSDWLHDGRALLVTTDAGAGGHDVLVQPADGSPAHPIVATSADETAARVSPDGRWIAYTSDESGRAEVYLDSYKQPGQRVTISQGGGVHPVWRGDGRELFYWHDDGLVAVELDAPSGDALPAAREQTMLFRAPYQNSINTMYDVSPDGQRFVIVERR